MEIQEVTIGSIESEPQGPVFVAMKAWIGTGSYVTRLYPRDHAIFSMTNDEARRTLIEDLITDLTSERA